MDTGQSWKKLEHSWIQQTGDIPWAPFPLPGTFFKLLRLDFYTGQQVFLLRVPAGLGTGLHRHLAAVEVYVLSGGFVYPGEGEMRTGSYVFEPGGCVHEPIADPGEDLVMLVFAQGPIQGVGADGSLLGTLDLDAIWNAAVEGGNAAFAFRIG
jgi:2,4'-dihydroxyacetophenone dioxygenase